MSTLNGKSVASTYDQVVKRQDSYSATGNQIEIMDDSGVIKTTPLYLDSVNSRVGIGTDSPEGLLHVSEADFTDLALLERSGRTSDIVWGAARTLATKTTDMGDGFGSSVVFTIQDDAGVINLVGSIGAVRAGADNTGDIVFEPTTSGTANERMRITSSGNVGIGTTSPDANTKLDVVGVIRASGGIQPNGNAYSASEVLDDYEEGTFTFQFYDAVSGGNASATTNTGHYTKIGNVVVARVYAYNNPSTSGMTSGNVLYFTLPFTAGANGYTTGACIVRGVDLNSRTSIATDLRGSASRGTFQTIGDGLDMANVLVSHWTSGSDDLNMLTLTYAT